MSTHPSMLAIDGLASGQLDDAAARAHVETCERCTGDLRTAETACAQFTREVLPRTVATLQAPQPSRSPWRWLGPALVPVLAAATLLLWYGRRPAGDPDEDPRDDSIRRKGGLTFQVFANRNDEVIPVRDNTRLAAGDKIRFVAGADGPAYLLIASIDGAGTATVYYPYNGAHSGPVTKQPSELPGSIVLDAAPGPERVFALATAEPLDAAMVKRVLVEIGARGHAAIRDTRTLDVPALQASVVFEKAAP